MIGHVERAGMTYRVAVDASKTLNEGTKVTGDLLATRQRGAG